MPFIILSHPEGEVLVERSKIPQVGQTIKVIRSQVKGWLRGRIFDLAFCCAPSKFVVTHGDMTKTISAVIPYRTEEEKKESSAFGRPRIQVEFPFFMIDDLKPNS